MKFLSDIRIKPKLITLFLTIGIIPLLTVGFLGSKLANDSLLDKSFDQLNTVQSIRKTQIEEFFEGCFSDITILAQSPRVLALVESLDGYVEGERKKGNRFNVNSEYYRKAIAPYHGPLKEFTDQYNYHDMFIIDAAHGDILFTTALESDLGTNLSKGKHKNSGLAQAWREAIENGNIAISDFKPYAPSNNLQSAFFATPVRDANDNIVGVMAMQITSELVTKAVHSRQGLGETGESYLLYISEDKKDFVLRSNLQSVGEGKFVIGFVLDTVLDYWDHAYSAGVKGGSGTYTDSQGKAVLATYNKLEIEGLNWYLFSKINKDEVLAPIRNYYSQVSIAASVLFFITLALALFFSKSITDPIIEDMKFAQAISEGKLDTTLNIEQQDELGDLARALNTMARKLQELDWLKTGKEGLDDELRGEHDADELAKRMIKFITKHLEAQLGAIYLLNDEYLELKASYAFADRSGNFNRIKLGEGIVGQAAMENELISFTDIQRDAPSINYGAGEVTPSNFLAVPASFEGNVIGVLLLGSTTHFTPQHRRFIEQNSENSAILMNAAKSRQVIRELLSQAQEQQEELRASNEELAEQTEALKESEAELQAQQEELRVTNEELEEQTKALKESEAELQAQQEELRVTNEELEERTKALEEQTDTIGKKNRDLVKAQEIVRQKARDLEQASKYKSEFLANMSHELRTPLNSILILSQLFGNNKDGNLTQKQIESANAIHSSGSDLLNLINEILDLSKVEAGKIELVIEDVTLDSIEMDLMRVYQDMATEKGVAFEINRDQGLPASIQSDSQRLQQILRNLITNAIKFTSQGTVSISMKRPTAEQLEGSNLTPANSVAFAVKDDGIGIAEDKQMAIFQAFQQADGSTSRNYGGTGLGLSISKELTALLGGVIRLVSAESEGSTFTVIMPETYSKTYRPNEILPEGLLPEAPAQEQEQSYVVENPGDKIELPTPAPVAKELAPKPVLTPTTTPKDKEYLDDDRNSLTPETKSLLIIEDDRNFAKIMRDFARERGYLCLVAEDGETGLHFADYYKPSAIILDIGLPGIDGWTVMERLKDNPDLRHIPVHFMSASDSNLDAMRMGAIGFLSKPVSMDKVEDAFARIEDIVSKPVSKLLLVEDDQIQQDSIKMLIGDGDVDITAVKTGWEAFDELVEGNYDCMVLDLGLQDMSGFDLLEKIRLSEIASRVPVIIYTGRELTQNEEKQLSQYAESIIIKGVKSPERLLEESALFLHRVEAELPEEKQKMLKMVHDKESVLSGKTVLLVDDDMRNVFALTSVLEDKNMEVLIARNGLEALDKIKEHEKIDCILMDIMMPKMDGYEAMTEIRKDRKYEKLPIIALTAKAMKGDRSKCIDAGASDYLAKPVNTDKLLSMMRVWLY